MKQREIRIGFEEYGGIDELPQEMAELIKEARKASEKAWSPYSGFCVGAAVKLTNGIILKGNNQENSAYPSGLCAERTALFYANANYPDIPVEAIAISAHHAKGLVREPVKPCGSCRQVLLETEIRYHHPIRIILDGQNAVYVFNGIEGLLPLSFKPVSLKG